MFNTHEELVEAVRKVSGAASYWMEHSKECDFFHSTKTLCHCFNWRNTPQGHKYWWDVEDTILEVAPEFRRVPSANITQEREPKEVLSKEEVRVLAIHYGLIPENAIEDLQERLISLKEIPGTQTVSQACNEWNGCSDWDNLDCKDCPINVVVGSDLLVASRKTQIDSFIDKWGGI